MDKNKDKNKKEDGIEREEPVIILPDLNNQRIGNIIWTTDNYKIFFLRMIVLVEPLKIFEIADVLKGKV